MYTDAQVLEGLYNYIRREILPALPTSAKLLAGAALLHNSGRAGELLRDPKTATALTTIGLVSKDGMIDVDCWCNDMRNSIEEFCGGRAEVQLPLLAPMVFTAGDIETMKRYLKGELR